MPGLFSLSAVRAVSRNTRRPSRRRAVTMVVVVVTLPVMLGMAALTIDVGYLQLIRQELQTSADAGALAAAWSLFDEDGNLLPEIATLTAIEIAGENSTDATHELTFGWIDNIWDPASPFVATAPDDANAFRVTSRRTVGAGNPVELFFAGIFGRTVTDVSASAVAVLSPASSVDGVPVALRTPGFGPIDPDIAAANPGKDGPSEPADGQAFQLGEQVTVFIFGKGKKSPVHLVLNTNDIPGEAHLGKLLEGIDPPVSLSIGDEIDVVGDGTGHNGLGGKLAKRLTDDDPSNDTVVLPVVETLSTTRNSSGEVDGNVRIVDFVAVHLDAVIESTIPDPNDPQDNDKTITIELLVGTVVQQSVSGSAAGDGSGFVAGASAAVPQLIR